jgi:hypothetical protein
MRSERVRNFDSMHTSLAVCFPELIRDLESPLRGFVPCPGIPVRRCWKSVALITKCLRRRAEADAQTRRLGRDSLPHTPA